MKTQMYSLKNFALFLLLGFIIILSSCEEEPGLIGLDLQSQNEKLGVGYNDSTTIVAYSVFDDSLRTDNFLGDVLNANFSSSLSVNLWDKMLGTFNDPVFGTTSASIFTQIRLSTISPGFPSQASLDSLVLYLPYTGSYQVADNSVKATPIHIKVYEVNEKMFPDSIYYYNRMLDYKPSEIADLSFISNAKDSVIIGGIKYPPLLQIKLSATPEGIDLGNRLLSSANASNLADNDIFTGFFKGLYIKSLPLNTSQANKGSMMYFNLFSSSLAKMTLFYKKSSADTVSTKFDFVINDKCAKYTHFNHYAYNGSNSTLSANSDFKNQLGVGGSPNPGLGEQKLYLQSMGGVKINLKFPYLRDLIKDKKVVINEAVLVIKNDDTDDKNAPPLMITVLKKLAAGKIAFLPDAFEGFNFLGGTYNATTREYRMRITRYYQLMLNTTDEDYGLVMVIDNRRTTANRFVLKGTDKTMANRMKLELKYTVIK